MGKHPAVHGNVNTGLKRLHRGNSAADIKHGITGFEQGRFQGSGQDHGLVFYICQASGEACLEAAEQVWTSVVAAAEEAYDTSATCSFTAFAGYEYSGSPNIANNHRNVIFRNANVPSPPPSYYEEPLEQELWEALDHACIDDGSGCGCIRPCYIIKR